MSERPRLLFLCQTLPYPLDSGVAIRTYNILRLLARTFDVTTLCFYRRKHGTSADEVRKSVQALRKLVEAEAFSIPQEASRLRFVWDHARSVMLRRAYTVFAYESVPYRRHLRELLANRSFDLVHVDSLDLCGYLAELESLPVVCVHHNVESQLLRRRAEHETSWLRRRYLSHQAGLVESEERRFVGSLALNVTVSDDDRKELGRLAPGGRFTVVPNGVDCEFFRAEDGEARSVGFLGGTNWFPNRDGLEYFCDSILPILRRKGLALPIRWIGHCTVKEQRHFRERYDVELTGYLEDIRPALRDTACCVVPLRVGGGTRLKIVTAWAAGTAMVSTSLGCEGLDVQDGENILVRDEPESFADAVLDIIRDEELRRRLQLAARTTAEERYSWEVIGNQMVTSYLQLISRDVHDAGTSSIDAAVAETPS